MSVKSLMIDENDLVYNNGFDKLVAVKKMLIEKGTYLLDAWNTEKWRVDTDGTPYKQFKKLANLRVEVVQLSDGEYRVSWDGFVMMFTNYMSLAAAKRGACEDFQWIDIADFFSPYNFQPIPENILSECRKWPKLIDGLIASQISPQLSRKCNMYLVATKDVNKRYLRETWDNACHNGSNKAKELFRAIKADPNEKIEETDEDFDRIFAEYYRIFTPWVCEV